MNFSFSGETERERRLFLTVVRNLLNLNLGELETTVEVSFVADPTPEAHNEFAYTEGTSIAIRTDAPDFAGLDPTGQQWGMPFFNEVVAHELCHALLALMDGLDQEKIAALFGATPADWGDGARWEDRPLEGICETFKDAFLPRDQRRYSNRTNQRIPIREYGRFRRLFRRARYRAETGAGSDLFLLGGWTDEFVVAGFEDELGLRRPSALQWEVSPPQTQNYQAQGETDSLAPDLIGPPPVPVVPGEEYEYSFSIPADWTPGEAWIGGWFQWFFYKYYYGEGGAFLDDDYFTEYEVRFRDFPDPWAEYTFSGTLGELHSVSPGPGSTDLPAVTLTERFTVPEGAALMGFAGVLNGYNIGASQVGAGLTPAEMITEVHAHLPSLRAIGLTEMTPLEPRAEVAPGGRVSGRRRLGATVRGSRIRT